MKSQATRLQPRHKTHAASVLALLRAAASTMQSHVAQKSAIFVGGVLAVAGLTMSAIVVQAFTTDRLAPEARLVQLSLESEQLPGGLAAQDNSSNLSNLALPAEPAAHVEAEPAEPALIEQHITIRSGDSLALIFDRAGFSARQLYELVNQSEHGDDLARIYPGKELIFFSNDSGDLLRLEYKLSALNSIAIERTADGYVSQKIERVPDAFPVVRNGEITSSFYLAGLKSGLTDNLIMELAALFGWDIDFVLEIRAGDTFQVAYEELYLDGVLVGQGDILAAEFVNQGRSYRALRHVFADGSTDYYTPDGESMRKAFLRAPLDVFRISSSFDPYRKHPVLNTIRAHNGTDYAAPTGTPIRAAGDGRIASARYSDSYGNVVEIQHGENHQTLYAHMSRFAPGIRAGVKVEQGQIIGYVGMTGLATGPHLHYEFYLNGVVRNPVTVELPNGDPLTGQELARFAQASKTLVQLLDNQSMQLANDSETPDSQI